MGVKKWRLRKRSGANSKQLPKPFVLYLDRNLGNHVVANTLREADHLVEIHDNHLPANAPDEDWIRLCAKNGWVAVTKDKNIRYRKAELDTIVAYKACVFVVRAKNSTGPEIAELLVKYHGRLKRFAERTPAPFIAGVPRSGRILNYKNTGLITLS